MKYILYKDRTGLCKTRKGEELSDVVTLQFAGDGSEMRVGIRSEENGERFYKITEGSVAIPKSAFKDGLNQITVYGSDKLWKCEELVLHDGFLHPNGCDSTEEILNFKSEYEKLYKRLALCEAQISELKRAVNGAKLFE